MLQSSLVDAVTALPYRPLAVVVGVLVVGVAVRRLLGRRLLAPLRRRLVFGIPWGTLLTAAGVLAIYLFVQGAYWHGRPLVTPFRTWSYGYPLGMLMGPFAHGSEGHVTGNLLGTLVYGTVVEYAWSHYPQRRGTTSFSSLGTTPFARILAVPLGMAVVGVFTGVFALGPIVGFSGVVFALAGFAVVVRPYLFLGGLFVSRILNLLLSALQSPEPTVGGSVQFVTPWWANIAIQGHAIGLFTGVFLAAGLLWARSERPDPDRVFFATLVFAVSQGLWAVYAPVGGGRYTLFRWLGTVLVFLLALLVATATTLTDERLVPDFDGGWASLAGFALIVALGALCLASVPANLAGVGPADVPDDGIEVRDYVVSYEENVTDAYAASIPLPVDATENLTTSGVVVASAEREIWITAVSRGSLALRERTSVAVGGLGWRETVRVNRTGWSPVGNDSVYRVQLSHDNQSLTAFRSDPSTADATLSNRNVTLQSADDGFEVAVRRGNETLGTGPIPANMSSTTVGGLTFDRNRSRLYAGANGTRVPIAVAQG